MSKTLIIVLIAGVAFLLVGGIAWAKYRGYCRMAGPERMVEHVTDQLQLDETQRGKLTTFSQSLSGMRDQWRQRRGDVRDEVLALLETPSFDRDQAADILEQRHLAWRERGDELVARFADFSDSLSIGQREKLRTLIEEKMHGRWHRPAWSH